MGAAITAFEDFLIIPPFWCDWRREKAWLVPLNLSEVQCVRRLRDKHGPRKVRSGKGNRGTKQDLFILVVVP